MYEGYIHKCPNCGEVLEAFVTVCPACGYEIRDAKSSSSVQELASKLENITAEKMPTFEEKKSIMKMLFGKDFKEGNEAEEALKRFELQKSHEKASLISLSFIMPSEILRYVFSDIHINIISAIFIEYLMAQSRIQLSLHIPVTRQTQAFQLLSELSHAADTGIVRPSDKQHRKIRLRTPPPLQAVGILHQFKKRQKSVIRKHETAAGVFFICRYCLRIRTDPCK